MRTRLTCLALFAAVGLPAAAQSPTPPLAPDTSWVRRSALYEVFVRDFSPAGTFRGVIEGLDRIQASGADVLWLMPIHPIGVKNRKGTFGSPYAVKDYRAVNPDYGTAQDFRALVDAVHARGMKLILDWVPNHTAPDHPWIREHPDWYFRDAKGQPMVPRDEKGKLTDWTDVAQLDYQVPALRREMIATMRHWLQEYGIDGFRVDVAGFMPYDYWREATPQIRAAVPRPILLLAEWGDLEMHRLGFDLTYGWDSYKRLKEVWGGAPASGFVAAELADMRAMPAGGMRMRFTTNHDETAWDQPPLALFAGSPGARAAFVANGLLPGRPLLYNGQEVENPEKVALFEKKPLAWAQPGAGEALSFYSRVVKLARTELALLSRELREVQTSAMNDVIAYRRGDVVVLVNARARPLSVVVPELSDSGSWNLLADRLQRGDTVALPAYGAAVLKSVKTRVRAAAPEDEIIYHIFVRSFRDSDGDRIGDLRGITEKLGYIQDLGATSILLTPINPSPFYHNYFASSFEGIDREYGDSASYRDLVQAVHARGMKIYLDQEIQYVAEDHPWLRQSLGQPRSEYGRYVLYNGAGNTRPEPGIFDLSVVPVYNGDKFSIATVNLHGAEVRGYFEDLFGAMVDPNGDGRFDDGVDGFRIDHMMDDLDLKGKLEGLFARFWAPVFAHARGINPRVKFVAEQYDWTYGDDFLTRGGTDMVFAFPIRNAIVSFQRRGIADSIAETWRRTPAGKGQLLFVENHDMNRFATEVAGDGRKERIGAALTLLLRGTPLIYYGQELGMRGRQSKSWGTDANDIPVREAFEWSAREDAPGTATWYRDTGEWWTGRFAQDGDGISVEEQENDPASLLSFYQRLTALRQARPELRSGAQRVVGTDRDQVLAVLRTTDQQASLLLVNLADSAVSVTVRREELPAGLQGPRLRDLLSDRSAGASPVQLPAYGVKLLAR